MRLPKVNNANFPDKGNMTPQAPDCLPFPFWFGFRRITAVEPFPLEPEEMAGAPLSPATLSLQRESERMSSYQHAKPHWLALTDKLQN